jgi:molybdopterin molybdotransferase
VRSPPSLTAVGDALQQVLASVQKPVASEEIPLADAHLRTLAADVTARRTQPPFPASAMDGYAVRGADLSGSPTLKVIGMSAAGHGFAGTVGPGEAVRIFTGAPLPQGADSIVIQENTKAEDGAVTIAPHMTAGRHIRPAGVDFNAGDVLLRAGHRLDARRLALAAAAGHAALPVRRRPRVAILATGDELVRPGEAAGPDQIVASNSYGVAAFVEAAGGEAHDLGIAGDDLAELRGVIGEAEGKADVLVTLGGASVGEHDLVQEALTGAGMTLGFWRIAMRPGKPLMFGRLGRTIALGLPGNPVSSMVCAILFVVPLVRALVGDPQAGRDISVAATLGSGLRENDERQDYLRATLTSEGPDGLPVATPLARQDSSLLSVLGEADGLIVRPPHALASQMGERCRIIRLADVGR